MSDKAKLNFDNNEYEFQVVTGSGMSGAQTKIRIRGANSAVASSEPLFVVDGIIMEDGNYLDRGNNVGFMDIETNLLSSINPNDIQSMEILKDAAATAIYGARGSNGVILITTKQGQSGDTKIEDTLSRLRPKALLLHRQQ